MWGNRRRASILSDAVMLKAGLSAALYNFWQSAKLKPTYQGS